MNVERFFTNQLRMNLNARKKSIFLFLSDSSQSLNIFNQIGIVLLVFDRCDIHDLNFIPCSVLKCETFHCKTIRFYSKYSYPKILNFRTQLENVAFEKDIRNHLLQCIFIVVECITNLLRRMFQ